jgi:transcriptional regulator with XRE-family HTH domain
LDTFGPTEVAAALGPRVRSLRLQRGLTLKELGRLADLSHPFLSQLERGLARPSVGSAERIARALDVPLGLLWAAPSRSGHATLIRHEAGEHESHPDRSAPGGLRTVLTEGVAMEVLEWTGGSRRWPDEHDVEPGDLVVYVARGGLEVELDGDVHALEEGDTLLFDGSVPHRFRRTGGVSTRVLRVTLPSA